MLLFPPAKINIGLRILRKRPDGYHELSTIMAPTGWTDVLEAVPGTSGKHTLSIGGANVPECAIDDNLVMKAIRAFETELGRPLPPLDFYLEKIVPFGAGLGGGSADASYALIAANEVLSLGLTPDELARVATRVGADCPFFIHNYYSGLPQLAEGIGERLSPVDIPELNGLFIAIAKPAGTAIPTREAYAGVRPCELPVGVSLAENTSHPVREWQKSALSNDFEQSIFPSHPEIEAVKNHFLNAGALYAAMSGSGAAVFGLFDTEDAAARALAGLSGSQMHVSRL